MDKRFLTAFIAPKRCRLVGFELRPFCIKQILVLHAFQSPYLKLDTIPTPAQTIQFLRVCSLDDPNINNIRAGFLDSLFASRLFVDHAYHGKVIKGIIDYIYEYSSPPKVVKKNGRNIEEVLEDNRDDVPSLLLMMTAAMSKLNLSEEEAMTMPLGRLAWYTASYAMLEGAEIRFIGTETEERAELDRRSLLEHEKMMKLRLLKAMEDGRIPRREVRTTSQ